MSYQLRKEWQVIPIGEQALKFSEDPRSGLLTHIHTNKHTHTQTQREREREKITSRS